MSAPDPAKLVLEAQLKALATKLDVNNPLGDIKNSIAVLVEAVKAARGSNATKPDNDARVTIMHILSDSNVLDRTALGEMRTTLSEVEAVRGLQGELYEQLGHALARLNEARAHVALANATMAKLIATVTTQVDASIKRDAEKAAAPALGQTLRLQIHTPGVAVREETFTDGVLKVGKLPGHHLKLDDDNVSRMHAVIERVDSPGGGVTNQSEAGWYVIDLGSATGTIVNDRKVAKAKLSWGDTMLFGNVSVRVLG